MNGQKYVKMSVLIWILHLFRSAFVQLYLEFYAFQFSWAYDLCNFVQTFSLGYVKN